MLQEVGRGGSETREGGEKRGKRFVQKIWHLILTPAQLPSMLPDELSANITGSNGFFSQRKVCTISYIIAPVFITVQLERATKLLSFFKGSTRAVCAAGLHGTHGTAAHYAITRSPSVHQEYTYSCIFVGFSVICATQLAWTNRNWYLPLHEILLL